MEETREQQLISELSLQTWGWVDKPPHNSLLKLADKWGVDVRRNWRGKVDVEYLIHRLAIYAIHERK